MYLPHHYCKSYSHKTTKVCFLFLHRLSSPFQHRLPQEPKLLSHPQLLRRLRFFSLSAPLLSYQFTPLLSLVPPFPCSSYYSLLPSCMYTSNLSPSADLDKEDNTRSFREHTDGAPAAFSTVWYCFQVADTASICCSSSSNHGSIYKSSIFQKRRLWSSE